METKKLEKNAGKNGGTGLYWAAVLAFWALAFALGVVRTSELGASYPWGGIAVFALGALILSGPFLAVEICRSRSLGEFGANASRILGAGFVGTVFGSVSGLYWAAPLFFGVWFALKRKTTALGPTLRRFSGRILTALVATAVWLAAARGRRERRFGRDGTRLSRDSRSVRRFLRDGGACVCVGCV